MDAENAILVAISIFEARKVLSHDLLCLRQSQEVCSQERRARLDQVDGVWRFRVDTSELPCLLEQFLIMRYLLGKLVVDFAH